MTTVASLPFPRSLPDFMRLFPEDREERCELILTIEDVAAIAKQYAAHVAQTKETK